MFETDAGLSDDGAQLFFSPHPSSIKDEKARTIIGYKASGSRNGAHLNLVCKGENMEKAQIKPIGKEKPCKIIRIDAYRKSKTRLLSKAKSLELFLKFDEEASVFD